MPEPAVSSTHAYEATSLVGRALVLALSPYAIVVFAALAATLGAYFVEARNEREGQEATDA